MFKKKVKVQPQRPFPHIEFFDILKATNNFDDLLKLGRGFLADVYKAPVSDGETTVLAAIKRLNFSAMDGAPESWPELDALATFRHPNLASLIAYCSFVEDVHGLYLRKEIVLVYEYFPHGSLKDHLHVRKTPLSWLTRLNICIGVARALNYLHTRTGTKTDTAPMHGHLMSSNIFLTESWTAKVSDFGLAKYGPSNRCPPLKQISGAAGYCDAYSLVSRGQLTKKSDVYSLGAVLLEVLCRKLVVDVDADRDLLTWVRDSIKQGRRLENIVDPEIKNEVSAKSLKDFYEIAERCLCERPEERPAMAEVLNDLESGMPSTS